MIEWELLRRHEERCQEPTEGKGSPHQSDASERRNCQCGHVCGKPSEPANPVAYMIQHPQEMMVAMQMMMQMRQYHMMMAAVVNQATSSNPSAALRRK